MRSLFFLLATLCMAAAMGQSYTYDVKAVGINAGTLVVTKKVQNGLEYYTLESHTKVNYVLGKIKVDHITKSTYKNGQLLNSYVRNEKNDEVEYYSSVDFDGSKYNVTNEKGKKTVSRNVDYSICLIFFKEPVDKTEVFSERLGEFGKINPKGNHTYEISLSNGDKYTYYYENGQIVKADAPSPIGKAHFYLRK